MTPYYEEDGITIYHGDCREVLPTLGRFDLLLTDPPYGIGMAGKKGDTRRAGYENLGWDSSTPSGEVFHLLFSVSNDQIIWGGNYFCTHLPPTMGWLVWDKGQRIMQSDGELAFTSFSKALRIYELRRKRIDQDGAYHPTQKPVELMKWCISQSPMPVASVLDAFCGSGTTLVAAKDMGIAATGIEREEKYCEIAAKRLSQRVLAFDAEPLEAYPV